jgi:hypothetical protein
MSSPLGCCCNDAPVGEAGTVELRPDENRDTVLRLSFPEPRDPDGYWLLDVEVEANGLKCSHGVLTYWGDGLDEFVRTLAADWRGWDGTRRWDALENGMSIEAVHRGSRVALLFILRRDFEPDAWEIHLPMLVAPGESLSSFGRALTDLVSLGRHS